MMQIDIERRKYTRPFMDMTPMIDVVFQLVLFFVLTSNFIHEPAINISLPESKTAVQLDSSVLTLTISSSSVFVEDREVAFDDLDTILRGHAAQHDEGTVRIRADRQVSVDRLVQVIDRVRMAGIKGFAIMTEGSQSQ